MIALSFRVPRGFDIRDTIFHLIYNFQHKPPEDRCKSFLRHADSDMQVDITRVALLKVINPHEVMIALSFRVPRGFDIRDTIFHLIYNFQQCDTDLMGALSSHAVGRDINSAIYWLFFRLGMNSKTT
jgi:hypothetical protein